MPCYLVKVGSRSKVWNVVEAPSEQEAAEKACGFRVHPEGDTRDLCARVRAQGNSELESAIPFFKARNAGI